MGAMAERANIARILKEYGITNARYQVRWLSPYRSCAPEYDVTFRDWDHAPNTTMAVYYELRLIRNSDDEGPRYSVEFTGANIAGWVLDSRTGYSPIWRKEKA